jgi:hypothetical protein
LRKLKDTLKPKGKLLITVPLGYNTEVDEMIKDNLFSFTERYFMTRVNALNIWKETTLDYVLKYPSKISIAVLIYSAS